MPELWEEGEVGMTKHEAVEILEEIRTLDDSMFAYSQAYNDALEMAIGVLKAQEPRVMTLEEVVALQEGKGDVWIEETAMPGITPWIIAATLTEKTDWQEHEALWFSDDQCHYVTDYNLNTADGWRCWTSRPTDTQREAVKWDD